MMAGPATAAAGAPCQSAGSSTRRFEVGMTLTMQSGSGTPVEALLLERDQIAAWKHICCSPGRHDRLQSDANASDTGEIQSHAPIEVPQPVKGTRSRRRTAQRRRIGRFAGATPPSELTNGR